MPPRLWLPCSSFSLRSSPSHLFPGTWQHCPRSWGAEVWAATLLYSGNMITSDRVCFSFAVGASDVQVTLERHSISRDSCLLKGRCTNCSLKTCFSSTWLPSGCTRELGSGLGQDIHLPTSHRPRSMPGPQGSPQGPVLSLISAAVLGCEAQNFIGRAGVDLCMPLDMHYHRDPAGGGRSLPCHLFPAPLGEGGFLK